MTDNNTIMDSFNFEIVRELLLEIDDEITTEEIHKIYDLCQGNPWNAGILYQILRGNN